MDVGLLLKLQNRVRDLEREKAAMRERLDAYDDDTSRGSIVSDSAFDALKVIVFYVTRLDKLEESSLLYFFLFFS